jgi:predicted phage terminase large subunit-like protein
MKKQAHSAKPRIKSHLRLPSGSIIGRARQEACRLDFTSFIQVIFDLMAPGRQLLMNWHIQKLAYHLEQVRLGRSKRLIINLPPRFLKSLITSVAFPAYVLGHDPTKHIIVVSYGLELAIKFGNGSRTIMSSDRYKGTFPRTRLARNTECEIVTTQGGYRLATSIDGPLLTGFGGDIIIIDDPIKLSDAESESKREHVNKFFRKTVLQRLDDNVNGAIIIVTQRSGPDDLSGTLLKPPNSWDVLTLPLIAERDEQIQIGENLYHLRQAGDLLHPEWFPQEALDERRAVLDEATFAAHYQQCPIQPAGMMIKRDAIKRYDLLPIRTKSHFIIQSWDTAIKTDAHHDYSPCVTLLVDDRGNYYVIDVLRDRLLYHQLKAQAIAQAQKHRPNRILIEEAGLVGRTLVKDLKAAGLPAVGVVPDGDKPTRASIQVEKFENGQVFFPREAPWLADFETELLAFPNGSYDDQVDALIQGLAYKRPAEYDAALPGFENLVTGLWLSKMRGF